MTYSRKNQRMVKTTCRKGNVHCKLRPRLGDDENQPGSICRNFKRYRTKHRQTERSWQLVSWLNSNRFLRVRVRVLGKIISHIRTVHSNLIPGKFIHTIHAEWLRIISCNSRDCLLTFYLPEFFYETFYYRNFVFLDHSDWKALFRECQ